MNEKSRQFGEGPNDMVCAPSAWRVAELDAIGRVLTAEYVTDLARIAELVATWCRCGGSRSIRIEPTLSAEELHALDTFFGRYRHRVKES